MDSIRTVGDSVVMVTNEKESMVDPFLVEALQNPRHRLTILRMELDIQKFLRSPDQQLYEFQQFPTSYLRLAAHRVAQHYRLITMVQDNNSLDGFGNKILVRKTTESRFPAVCLSDISMKQSESDKLENIKFAIKPRPSRGLANGANGMEFKRSPMRTVEERKEEYDRARARIFSSPNSPESDHSSAQGPLDGKCTYPSKEENELRKNSPMDQERNGGGRDGGTSYRVAILRDREKDRSDPDYDRSYKRYVRSLPANPANQSFNLAPFNMQKIQVPYMQYDTVFSPMGQIPRAQASLSYRPLASPNMSSFCDMGFNQMSRDAVYMQLPSAAMMYAHSYEPFRHAPFQVPFCQQQPFEL